MMQESSFDNLYIAVVSVPKKRQACSEDLNLIEIVVNIKYYWRFKTFSLC